MTPRAQIGLARAAWWAAAALFSILAGLVALRAFLVFRSIGKLIACPHCFHVEIVLADLLSFAALASLLLLASCSVYRPLTRLIHLLCGVLILITAADVMVYHLYATRLLMVDVALFISEWVAVWNQFSTGMGGLAGALVILTLVAAFLVFLWWMPSARTRTFRLTLSAVIAVSLAASAFFQRAPYVHDWAVENVFVANMSTPSTNRYSPEVEERILASEVPRETWRKKGGAPGRGRNVILVIIESWSAWHSTLFRGFRDWTPQLDDAARDGLRLEHFHSIGFSTDKGLVGILGGQQIWAPFRHWRDTASFHSMWGIEESVPGAFNAHGYHAAFLTTGPSNLYDKGDWLRALGFDFVEGGEHPFYEGRDTFAFGAAPDRALYERAAQWMATAPQPWFLTLETVTSHQPYIDPETRKRSLEGVIRYTDREFGTFLAGLRADGFFDNGMLVVVSDHRTMTPIAPRELEQWGAAAHSRVPAFIIAPEFEPGSVQRTVFSQADLAPSFEWWLSGEVRLKPFQGVIFDPAFEGESCAFYSRADRRALVEVFCNGSHGSVILDGDHTRFVGPNDLSPERREQVLRVIARERLEARQRHLATTDN